MKDEKTLKRERPVIADNESEFSEDINKISNNGACAAVYPSSAPCPPFLSKLPTARDLITEAVFQLPNQEGSKQEIINMATMICPLARAENNKAFFKTLEQALSKYLTI